MNIDDLFESTQHLGGTYISRTMSSDRTPRLRIKTLLRLRRLRERRKLERLKDMELYYVMYNTKSDSGGDF